MKKQTAGKKNLKWILLAAFAVAVAVAVALVLAFGGREATQTQPVTESQQVTEQTHESDGKLYWNVEKKYYSGQQIVRSRRSDDLYYVRFATDGEQIDLPVADPLLVSYIDTLEVMGLVFDENGIVVGVLRVEEFAGRIAAEDYYVKSFDENSLVCNALGTWSGYTKKLKLTANTKVYGVDEQGSLLSGLPGQLQERSKILAVEGHDGTVTHIYAEAPFQVADIYWNTSRQYDSVNKLTKRPMDAMGRFEYVFALNGEQVTLYTKDEKVANAIDAVAAKCMGLIFDENGYITEVVSTKKATGNSSFGSWYHIMDIGDDNIVTATKYSGGANKGDTIRGTLSPDVKVYDCSGKGAFIGEPTQLRLYDQVHGLKNPYGEIIILFVVSRTYEAPIYWNVSRQWDSAAKQTKRLPAADGYYYIKLATGGQQVTLRTKDIEMVNSIDSVGVKCFGLHTDGDVITQFFPTNSVWGGRQFCSWDIVTSIQDNVVTAAEADKNKTPQDYVGPMAADCNVYNVSSTASVVGERTTLQVGDKIHALKDLDGNITHIFVVSRQINANIYWNLERKYDSANKVTTRKPNAQGYYEFKLAYNGEVKTYKTASKEMATKLDAVATRCFGLHTSGDVITQFFATANVVGGAQFCSWDDVTAIQGNTVTAKEADKSKTPQNYVGYLSSSTKVINVSDTAQTPGEKTTLQVGDKIHALMKDNVLTYVYVVDRQINANIYWNLERDYDSENQVTGREPNAEGYYAFKLAYNGEVKIYKTASKEMATKLDAVATRCFGLHTQGDLITQFYATSNVAGGEQFCSWDYVTAIQGSKITARESDENKQPQNYVGYLSSSTKVINVSGSAMEPGEKTTVQVGDKIHALKKDDTLTYVFVVERELPVVEKLAHCDHCDREVTWYSWDGTRAFESGKHYYLNRKTGITATAYIGSAEEEAAEVVLDLCGNDIRASARAFRIYGSFWLYDSGETEGTIHTTNSGQAPAFYVYDNGTMHMYGGNFVDDGKENTTCGLVGVGLNAGSKAVFNMYGGSLNGGTTVKDGGNVQLYRSAVMNLYGGSITGGVTGTAGGNINVGADAVLNLYGGTVTGGTAATGNGIHAAGTVNLFEQDPITVDDLFLAGAPVNITGTLAENSSITVTLASGNGPVSGDTVEANLGYFSSSQGQILYQGGKLMIWGEPDKTALCDHCGVQADWYIWNGSYAVSDGHYYLTQDISVSGVNRVEGTVCLDLCGNDIAGVKGITDRLFRIYGTLNLMDSAETDGVITTARISGQAPVFYVYENAVFNMYGGTIQGTGKVISTNGAGLGGVDKGTMNLYGGCITGGQSVGRGGNIAMYNTGTLNVYGGQITNGSSDANGGNISMDTASKLNLYGGSITGGELYGNGAITLYPDAKIMVDTLYLPASRLIAIEDTLAEESSVTLKLENTTGVFAENTLEANKVFFTGQQEITFADGKLSVGVTVVEPEAHKHCVCGGVGILGEHTECTEEEWTVLTQSMFDSPDGVIVTAIESEGILTGYQLAAGNYCLAEAVNLAATLDIASESTVSLCLNGKNLTGADRVFAINGTLNLTDCADADGQVTSTKMRQAPVFYVRDGGLFNLYGGTLKGTKQVSSNGGLGALGITAGGGAMMNLYGGTITGGSTNKPGGNLYLYHDSVLTVYGGTITGGTTTDNGGNIALGGTSKVVIRGGEISNGVAASGGNFLLDASGCSVEMYGGTVTGTTISGAGANLRIGAGTFKLFNGLVTGGTTTNGNGGSIFVTGSNAVMEMYGGTVTGGTANSGSTSRHGGNIYVTSNAKLRIVDDPGISGVPTVSNGTTTKNNGGNIYYGGKELVLDGALITGGSAPGHGQNVYINTAGAALKGMLTVCDEGKENIYVKIGISVDTTDLDAQANAQIVYG